MGWGGKMVGMSIKLIMIQFFWTHIELELKILNVEETNLHTHYVD